MKPGFDFWTIGRGVLMGGADIIPGVSGGTVALILGIYERLVTAVSHFDLQFLGHLKRREWKAAAAHVDFLFLLPLGIGILLGIGGLASLMHYLLENQPQYTFAVFFGLILGSSFLVWRLLPYWRIIDILYMVAGVAGTYYLVGLPIIQSPPEGHFYLFLCGVIAISAMILPGISGAFILLLLGKYEEITGTLKELLKGNVTGESLLGLGIFCVGCGVGLLGFSKFLRWLLENYKSATLAILCGVMIGSLRKLWPFKKEVILEIGKKIFVNQWPESWGSETLLTIALILLACGAILLLEWAASRSNRLTAAGEKPLGGL